MALGSIIGIAVVLQTKSIFLLAIGIAGLLGGFFYTAPPIKFGYRTIGEPFIGLLFGVLPIYGAYFLQTRTLDAFVLFPGIIVGIHIFLVILVNDFPDATADAAVGKKTFVVRFGFPAAILTYRITLLISYAAAILGIFIYRPFIFAGILYILTFPMALKAMKLVNNDDLDKAGNFAANKATIALHTITSLALTAGFVLYGLRQV